MERPTHRYRSGAEDSERWNGFAFRDGDIVISTRSKSGTTWMQMICALLIFQTPDLPRPLVELSPWLDWLVVPRDDVFRSLEAQEHRRFIKTHTPLDGLPFDDRATYVVVGRHPLDAAVSLYHQGANLDRQRMAELRGESAASPTSTGDRPALETWLRAWIAWDGDPMEQLDSMPGVFRHLGDAWHRRGDDKVVLVHYDDLLDDLAGQMRRLATELDVDIDDEAIDALAPAATFEAMKRRSDDLAPDPVGVLRERGRFFRHGTSGAGREALTAEDLVAYNERAASLAPPDLLEWLHRG